MKRTKIDKSEIIMKGDANRISDKGMAFPVKGRFRLLADRLVWQSHLGEFGKKEFVIPVDEIMDVTVKKPLLLQIWMKSGETFTFIIPIGVGKGRHKEDWQRVLREAAGLAPASDSAEIAEAKIETAATEDTDEAAAFCSQCGQRLRPGANFCTKCGAAVKGAR